jgi:hypothetical protein
MSKLTGRYDTTRQKVITNINFKQLKLKTASCKQQTASLNSTAHITAQQW